MKKTLIAAALTLVLVMPAHATLTLKLQNQNSAYNANDVHFMFYAPQGITATVGGVPVVAKKDYTLTQLSAGVVIDKYISGVVYVSLGKAMTEYRTSDPSPSNPTDADYKTRWDKMEVTVIPDPNDKANLTGINLFSIPMQLETSKGGTVSPTKLTYSVTGNEMTKKLGAITGQDAKAVLKDSTQKFLRVLGPSQYGSSTGNPYPTFDAYVKKIKDAGQSTQIEDHFYGSGTTNERKAQDYKFTAVVDKTTGNLKLTGGGAIVGYSHTLTIKAADVAYGIYSNDPPYTLDTSPAIRRVGDNDVYSAGVRDALSGFAIGFVGSTVTDPLTHKAFKDEASKAWYAQSTQSGGLAFSAATTFENYFNQYAEVFYKFSNSYGFPFSDRINGKVQISIGPSFADTLIATILTDGLTCSDSVTEAIANATAPAAWRAPAGTIVTIPDAGGTHGLKYDTSGKLIVRTLTKSSYYPANYVGEAGYTTFGAPATDATWVTTGKDLTAFYDENGYMATNDDLVAALEQGHGMYNTGTHDAIVEYAVTADNNTIHRPTKNPDIATYDPTQFGHDDVTYPFVKPADMSTAAFNDFVAYYTQWRTTAYTTPFDPAKSAPFTQLAYTYFWGFDADLDTIQGMSEFLIPGGTPVDIYGIYSTSSYIYTRNDDQFGNGYASFDIYDDCDTVWAGHRFQKGTSYSAASPNRITIGQDAIMYDGEGILVWSLNYDVTNYGIITGTTADKFGIAGTADIAILFKGDTSTAYGTPVTEGDNKLVNWGSIDSPGTAVKAENGDTTIVNNAGATITGTVCGIWLAKGTNSITNDGTIDGTGATAIRIDAGTATLANTGTINGNITMGAATTLDIGSSAVILGANGTFTQGAGSALKLMIDSATVYGRIQTTAASSLDATSSIFITTGTGSIPNNGTFNVVDTSGTGIGSVPGTIGTDSTFYSFSSAAVSNNLVITATRKATYTSFTSTPNAAAVATVLNDMAVNNTASGDMLTVLGQLDSMSTPQEIESAMESMTPSVDNSLPQVANLTLNQFVNVSVSRLDNFQGSPSAIVDAAEPTTPEIWAQGYGSYLHQDPMASSNGYDASVWGTAMGVDLPVSKPFKVGASGGFAQDFVRTKDFSGRTDIDSYQCALYCTYGWEKFFIDILPAFAYNTYGSSRNVTVGTLNRTASGDYDGQQYTAYAGCGYKIDFLRYLITPIASFQYTHLRVGGYEETGAGALSLKVDPQDYDVAQTGFGVKIARPFEAKNYTLIPELRFKWLYDWVGDEQQMTSTFTGGGGAFATNGFTPAQSSYDMGIKLTLISKQHITVSVNYDLELKEDYYSHNGYAELRWAF